MWKQQQHGLLGGAPRSAHEFCSSAQCRSPVTAIVIAPLAPHSLHSAPHTHSDARAVLIPKAETKGVVPGRTASSIRQRWCNKLRNKYIAEARARLAGQAVAAVGGAGEDKHAAGPAAGSADAGDPVPPAADSVEAPRYSFKRRGDGSEDDASAGGGSPKRVRLSDEDPFAVAAAAAAAAATAAAAAKGEHPASAPPPVVHISLPPPAVAPASPPPPPMSAERREEVCGWVDTLSRATAVGRRGVVQALLQTNADFAQAFDLLQGGPLQPE